MENIIPASQNLPIKIEFSYESQQLSKERRFFEATGHPETQSKVLPESLPIQ